MEDYWDRIERNAETRPAVARRLSTCLPLLAERDAIQDYLSEHPELRNALPEILDVEEAVLLMKLDWRLPEEECKELAAALSSPLSLERWKQAAEMAARPVLKSPPVA